jgi:hypothetical protein
MTASLGRPSLPTPFKTPVWRAFSDIRPKKDTSHVDRTLGGSGLSVDAPFTLVRAATRGRPAKCSGPASSSMVYGLRMRLIAVVIVLLLAACANPGSSRNVTSTPLSTSTASAGISVSSRGIIEVSPKASFRIAQLGYIPLGLTQREYTYVPPTVSPSTPQRIVTLTTAGSPVSEETLTAVSQLPADGRGALFLRYSAPGAVASYLEVTQQPLRIGQSVPAGELVAVGAVGAIVVHEGAVTRLFLTEFGTLVTIQTNLGGHEAVQVAQGLTWN